jgi:hypothetical protein
MMVRPRKYTDDVIAMIKQMLKDGRSNCEIAEVVGTTPNRLTSRLNQLGLTRKTLCVGKPPTWPVNIMVTQDVLVKFSAPAQARDMNAPQLMRAVLARVAADNLFAAILDDGK